MPARPAILSKGARPGYPKAAASLSKDSGQALRLVPAAMPTAQAATLRNRLAGYFNLKSSKLKSSLSLYIYIVKLYINYIIFNMFLIVAYIGNIGNMRNIGNILFFQIFYLLGP